jgi:predicted TIM-barrel fold metal-dependent hydrolase
MLTRRSWLASALALTVSPWQAQARHSGSGLPFPLFDAHAHLKSEDIARYPRAPAAPAAGATPSPPPGGEVPEVVRVLRWMDQNGVGGGAAVQHRDTYGVDNRYLLDSTDQYRHRLVPVVALDAEDPATPDTVRQLVDQHGIAGVRLTGARGADGGFPWLESPAAHRTWAAVNQAGLVMDLMTLPPGHSPPALAAYGQLASRYPRVRLVLDHCAWPDAAGPPDFGLSSAHLGLLAYHNISFKFTTVNLDLLRAANASTKLALRRFVALLGAARMMWGSDIGNSPGLYSEMVARMVAAASGLSRRDQRQLLLETGQAVMVAGGRGG